MRLAISFGVAASDFFTDCTAAPSASGSLPERRRSKSARLSAASACTRCDQAACAACPRLPAARQNPRASAGTSNGASDQPSALRAPVISSAPSGEPCDEALPALVGAPKPMVVRQAIIDGRSDVCAASSAAAIASGSWPSMRLAFQPAASKRFT